MYDDSFKSRYGSVPIAISETVGDVSTAAHIHNEIEILYILKGNSKIQIADKVYNASAGDLFFVNPLEVHSVIVEAESDYNHRCICFDAGLIVDKELSNKLLLSKKSIGKHILRNDVNYNELIAHFTALY